MSGRTIVMVSDLDEASRGEIHVLEGADEGARLIEALLESGLEQERIRIFVGEEMQMEVRHRPVVSLSAANSPIRTSEEAARSQEGSPMPQPPEEEEETSPVTARAHSLHFEEIAAEPFVKNGVRFSSLFRTG
jgi:hypothetical protein